MQPKYWNDATKHLTAACPTLGGVIASYYGETLISRGDAFHTLARSIAGQQISVKAADSVWVRVVAAASAHVKPSRSKKSRGPVCSTTPEGVLRQKQEEVTPQAILALTDEELRACGLSGQKVKYMRSLAEHFIQNKITETYWDNMTDEEVIADLTEIKGIGVWTAEMFLIFHLMRPDVYPLADLGLQKAILKHYPKMKGKEKDKIKMLKHAKQWKPYRSVATWYLWRSLDPIPVEY
ncbi:MAG: DNA-3-methyladenine glycosylase [Rickettsiales bacterium]